MSGEGLYGGFCECPFNLFVVDSTTGICQRCQRRRRAFISMPDPEADPKTPGNPDKRPE